MILTSDLRAERVTDIHLVHTILDLVLTRGGGRRLTYGRRVVYYNINVAIRPQCGVRCAAHHSVTHQRLSYLQHSNKTSHNKTLNVATRPQCGVRCAAHHSVTHQRLSYLQHSNTTSQNKTYTIL